MNHTKAAVACFRSGFNCAQAVLSTYAGNYGLSRDNALKVGSGFGGGMGRMGGVCSAVTGAYMVLGLHGGATDAQDAAAKQRTYALVQAFTQEFKSRHGCIGCRELLGCDISTPQGLHAAQERGLFTTLCPKLVGDAATILDELTAAPKTGPARAL